MSFTINEVSQKLINKVFQKDSVNFKILGVLSIPSFGNLSGVKILNLKNNTESMIELTNFNNDIKENKIIFSQNEEKTEAEEG